LFDFFDIRETTKNVIKHAGRLFVAHDEDHRNRADHVAAE
jgi:GntR family transcriptional regulator, carbon starvation induced regulator